MLKMIIFHKISIKNSHNRFQLNSFKDSYYPNYFFNGLNLLQLLYKNESWLKFYNLTNIEQTNIVLKDMLHLISAWRQLRGYPSGGATTHTNAKRSRKNKILFSFRLKQFQELFGAKKRNIYPTLIKAEYTNRLWFIIWRSEWNQAHKFVLKMLKIPKKQNLFNPVLLSAHQTNGYTRIGKASKIGKAKKLTKVFTIGVPLFFSRFIFYEKIPNSFPERLSLRDEINKKLGKKNVNINLFTIFFFSNVISYLNLFI